MICHYLVLTSISTACLAENRKSGFDKAWSYLTLYSNDENPAIQQFSLVGRAQIDSFWVSPQTPEEAEKGSDTIWRRFRFGFKANLFDDWTAHLEGAFDLNEAMEDWYTAITDGYIAWNPQKTLNIKLLKQSAGFTLDGATSSKRLLTLERNNLTHNFWFTRKFKWQTGLTWPDMKDDATDGGAYEGVTLSTGLRVYW